MKFVAGFLNRSSCETESLIMRDVRQTEVCRTLLLPQKSILQATIDGDYVTSRFRQPLRSEKEDPFGLVLGFDGRLRQRAFSIEVRQLVTQRFGFLALLKRNVVFRQ